MFVLILLGVPGQAQHNRPRTIVTTDGEVDDQDSFIRFLLYSNEMDIEGLIYSSSQWHYKGDGKGTKFISEMESTKARYGELTSLRWPGEEWMEELIDKYALVHPSLLRHDKNFPHPDYLKSIIRVGNIEFEGEMLKDTEGSDFIKEILLDENPDPVYIQIWGGTNTVARALKSIEEEYKETQEWDAVYEKVSAKAILYTVLDQDATYRKYIAPNWPTIRVFYNSAQFWSFAYLWPRVVPDPLKPYLEGKWFRENILENHGPLLAHYYTWGDGRQIENDPEHDHGQMKAAEKYGRKQYDFISEGDSPAYFFLLDVGLRSMENPAYGGWGGRMVPAPGNPHRWEDGKHVMDFNFYTDKEDDAFPQTRWINVLQHDFAARADWCVLDYPEANHAPKVSMKSPLDILAEAGEIVSLAGEAIDPDGDSLNFRWWQYGEAGSYSGTLTLPESNSSTISFTVPKDAQAGDEIHIIMEVNDTGAPSLTRYGRSIITVK